MGKSAYDNFIPPLDEGIGMEAIREIERRSHDIVAKIRAVAFEPNSEKFLKRRYNMTETAKLVGRTDTAIREAEKHGRLREPDIDPKGRRTGYTLEDINAMRGYFGTRPWRSDQDEPIVLAVQNFKGGVGKSTISCHLAQYLAQQGYRVCVVDCDSQASTTTIFGFNPDSDLDDGDTLLPYLTREGHLEDLSYAVNPTYWDGLDLIPSNLALYDAEYALAAEIHGNPLALNRLREGIDSIKHRYDVVIIDPPPALGMISLSVLRAANAMIVPVPPSTVDFSSTTHFFTMLVESLGILEKHGLHASYKFLRVVASKVNDNKSAHTEISKIMRSVYEMYILDSQMKDSAEIDNANARLMTVFELERAQTSKETYNRCLAHLNAVCGEIELLIRKTWASHQKILRREGVV